MQQATAAIVTSLKLERIDLSRCSVLKHRPDRFAVWQSLKFTVQAFHVPGNVVRLAVNRNELTGDTRLYADGITWEELQAIKDECGYADRMAVEIYPATDDVLNVINARHLWVIPIPLYFGWQGGQERLNIKS
jgi:hypothetical protein